MSKFHQIETVMEMIGMIIEQNRIILEMNAGLRQLEVEVSAIYNIFPTDPERI